MGVSGCHMYLTTIRSARHVDPEKVRDWEWGKQFTYITTKTRAQTATGELSYAEMVNNVHEIMELLVEYDPELVFYPFPANFKLPAANIPVYTADHINGDNGESRLEGRTGLKDYTSAIYSPRIRKPTWLKW